jgi:tetratricopeptide (TPR) repeat protein
MEKIKEISISFFKDFSDEHWNDVLNFFDATINYTSWFLNYIEVLNSANKIENYSFVLYKNNLPIAIVPLFVEKIDGKFQISMGQEPIDAPIFSYDVSCKDICEYYEYITLEIEKKVNRYKCILARFHYSPLLYSKESQNYFKKFGYKKEIFFPDWYIFKADQSYIIDLNLTKEELAKNIRSRYRTNINKTTRLVSLIILDKLNFKKEIFDKYVELYYEVKGPKRNNEAFRLDEYAVKNGFESILLCIYQDNIVSAVALHTYRNKARYNSSIQIYNKAKGIYPNHFLLKSAIDYLKRNDFDLFEIGEQVSESENYKISDKEFNLSHFKSGWGGQLTPWLKAQKEFKHVKYK